MYASRTVRAAGAAAAVLLLGACFAAIPVPSFNPAPAPAAALGSHGVEPTRPVDLSIHEIRYADVAPGVRIEIVDWGGQGPPLVLLAGLGSTAHVFDDFAPPLRDRFHVYGISRRGYGGSSQPKTGYDVATLGADVVNVMRSLRLQKASFVGHSVAGEELDWIAEHEPARVDKLVYLEAAYDRAARLDDPKDRPQMPALPDPSPADKSSLYTYNDYQERTFGVRMPEGELLSMCRFDAGGRYVGDRTPGEIDGAIYKGALPPNYARIAAPALAIYAVIEAPAGAFTAARWGALGAADRERAALVFAREAPIARANRDRFRREVPRGRVVEIPGANHYVFLSHQARVTEEIRAFLGHP